MVAIYRLSGEAIPYTPTSADVDAGSFVVQGELVGITRQKILKNKLGTVFTGGVYDNVPKATGALTLGQIAWLKTSDGKIYNAEGSGLAPVGFVLKAAASADTACTILLCPGMADGHITPITNIANASSPTGAALTDSTGGTSYTNHTLKAIEDSYTKATIAGNLATIATQIEANRADIAALTTKLNALLAGMQTGGLMAAASAS